MRARSLVFLAIAGEGALIVLALAWARWRGLPLEPGSVVPGVVAGGVGAGGLALTNLFLLCHAPAVGPVQSMRRLYVEVFKPLFGGVGLGSMLAISVAAGLGEELLFRGVLQPELGLVTASVLFGMAHMGGSGTFAFGCWAGAMGAALGGLAIWTDGLTAPIVAHTVYDAAAMIYIRRGKECPAVTREAEAEAEVEADSDPSAEGHA